MTFTQLTTRLKNFLMGWLLVLSLEKGLVECATACVKSEVILLSRVGLCLSHNGAQTIAKVGTTYFRIQQRPKYLAL